MAELFSEDPNFAAYYLNLMLQEGEWDDVQVALRQMALAHGGVRVAPDEAELNNKPLAPALLHQDAPELRSLFATLKSMGLRLAVQQVVPKQQPEYAVTTVSG